MTAPRFPVQTELELRLGLKPRAIPAAKESTEKPASAAHLGRVRKDIMAAIDALHDEQRHLLVTIYAELVEVKQELAELKDSLKPKDVKKGST